MYVQQRDEYLESFCKMATRKISVITIFGTMNNSSMKIDHFQLGSLSFNGLFPCRGENTDNKGRNLAGSRSRSKQDHLLWSSCTFIPILSPSMLTPLILHLLQCVWCFPCLGFQSCSFSIFSFLCGNS